MKLIIITKGNPEAEDPHHFTNIYECDYFELVHYDETNETWFKLYGYPGTPKTQNEMMVDYDPELNDLIVLP